MASNTDVVKKKLYYNMSVLCLYLCVCMSVSLQSSKLDLQTSQIVDDDARGSFHGKSS